MSTITQEYGSNVYLIYRYLRSEESPHLCKHTLKVDAAKCMCVGGVLALLTRFGLGKVHYSKTIKWAFLGGGWGLLYSVYFLGEKVEGYLVRRQLGLEEYDGL